ncbi:MAG: putative bifunctional diguanylate cyclase/phosphodiesterase [Luteimonas sp.]
MTDLSAEALLLRAVALIVLLLLLFMHARRRRSERRHVEQLMQREERFKLALWATGEHYWSYDVLTGKVNRLFAEDNAPQPADAMLESVLELERVVHPDDLPMVRERLQAVLDGSMMDVYQSEHRAMNIDSDFVWTRVRGRVVERDADGRVVRLAGTALNISHERSVERERQIATEVLRSMNEAVTVLDREFLFASINPAFTRITGYQQADVVGRSAALLDSSQHDPAFYAHVRALLARQGRFSGEMWQRRSDGEEFLCSIEANAVFDIDSEQQFYVAVLSDITQQKRAEQELRYLANFDALTNLPNRTLMSERLSRAIVRARRENNRIAVLFLDLDRFKDINDSLGHEVGDRILRAAAVRLQQTVGQHNTVARLGGDEFTAILENLDSPEDADRIAREIIASFEEPLLMDARQELSVTPSIGISLYPDHGQVPTMLLKHADTAMYQAKAAGRRTFMRYDDAMDVTIRHRATLSGALRKALDRGELRLVYQPRLSLSPSRITGVEALLRWTSHEHGEIGPAEFIPLAEDSGLILEIGEWVLREACLTLRRWHQHGLDHLSMAVNVSVLQLRRGDFPEVVRRVLDETGLPPTSLELELTESVLMASAEQTAIKLQAFRQMGVALAIDDFGTGYSSFAYLKRLPITTIKIDKAFIDDLTSDPEDAAITSAVITMAHSLGLNVVAEGVETAAQMRFLVDHGCDEVQGYLVSPPLDAHACVAFIRSWVPQRPPAITRAIG